MALMKHTEKITLFNSYFDMNDNLTPKSILNIFQDVAALHAEEIGVGFETMIKQNLYWVLSRIKFDILKMPKPNQTVIVETWPHEKGRIDFDRDLKITSENGETLIVATSKWCIIDSVSRSLQRTENINYNGEIFPDVNYEERFGKITTPDTDFKTQFIHTVKFADLDHNKHMNNTNYATLVLNTISNKNISHFEINFLNECLLGDEITLKHSKNDDGEYVLGVVDEKQTFIAFVK